LSIVGLTPVIPIREIGKSSNDLSIVKIRPHSFLLVTLYQDKEVRNKSKLNEENTFKDSVVEISGIYSDGK
jgi:hypothetical protein